MNPTDIEKVPGKRQLKMAKGGSVKSSASKRADGIAQKDVWSDVSNQQHSVL
jgi:hypothetical protein